MRQVINYNQVSSMCETQRGLLVVVESPGMKRKEVAIDLRFLKSEMTDAVRNVLEAYEDFKVNGIPPNQLDDFVS